MKSLFLSGRRYLLHRDHLKRSCRCWCLSSSPSVSRWRWVGTGLWLQVWSWWGGPTTTPHTLCLSGEWTTNFIIFMWSFSFVSSDPLCRLWPGSKITDGLHFPAASRTATQPGSTSWSCWCSRSRTLFCLRVQADPKTWRWTLRVSINITLLLFHVSSASVSLPVLMTLVSCSSAWRPVLWRGLPARSLSGSRRSSCRLLLSHSLPVSLQLPSQPAAHRHTHDPWHTLQSPSQQGEWERQ